MRIYSTCIRCSKGCRLKIPRIKFELELRINKNECLSVNTPVGVLYTGIGNFVREEYKFITTVVYLVNLVECLLMNGPAYIQIYTLLWPAKSS